MQERLAKRAISSTLWQSTSSIIGTAIIFVRSVLLARWVPVEAFGIYGYASAIISISVGLSDFGIGSAFIHRTTETMDESEAIANYFAVKMILTTIWATLVILGTFTLVDPQYRSALLTLTLIRTGTNLTSAPRLILQRRVVHRRLALLGSLNALFGTLAALALARLGVSVWALMATDLVGLVLNVIGLYCLQPVWRPKVRWTPYIVRYLLSFGARNFLAGLLARGSDQLDDLWTGSVLGSTAAGFYSKAYAFAGYPRRVVAAPLIEVSGGSYATLKGDRQHLSEAFFRVNAVLVRSGFLFGGLLVLVAPEFIRIFLGAHWLPMLDAFRLMLIFTLLDPIKATVAGLFTAVGHPEQVTKIRIIQLLVLIAGLVTLGPRYGIAGVAIAVNTMLFLGMARLLWQARAYVNFSTVQLFGVPSAALILGMTLARSTLLIPGILGSDWRTAGAKLCAFAVIYVGVLLSVERRRTMKMVSWTLTALRASAK